jgi:hypothetical protein
LVSHASQDPTSEPEARNTHTNISSAERRLITQTFFDKVFKATFNNIVGPVQNDVRMQARISITAFGVTVALDAAPEFSIIQEDQKNRYTKSHVKA